MSQIESGAQSTQPGPASAHRQTQARARVAVSQAPAGRVVGADGRVMARRPQYHGPHPYRVAIQSLQPGSLACHNTHRCIVIQTQLPSSSMSQYSMCIAIQKLYSLPPAGHNTMQCIVIQTPAIQPLSLSATIHSLPNCMPYIAIHLNLLQYNFFFHPLHTLAIQNLANYTPKVTIQFFLSQYNFYPLHIQRPKSRYNWAIA